MVKSATSNHSKKASSNSSNAGTSNIIFNHIDRQIALLLAALALGIYVRSASSSLLAGDPGEFQFAAWRLGLAHATGYPLYLLLGNAWQHLLNLVGISPAWALNLLSAIFGATAVGLLYKLMFNWLSAPILIRRIAAAFSTLLFALNPTFWSQNTIAETYTLHILFLVALLLALQNLQIKMHSSLFIIPLLLGLSLTHHAMTLFLIPGLILTLWLTKRPFKPLTSISALLLTALPLLLYLYIPLRSTPSASPWYHPILGNETLVLYQNSWQGFLDFITGRSISVGFYSIGEALGNLPQAWTFWRFNFYWPGIVLILIGLYALFRQRNWPVLILTLSYALIQQGFNLFYAIGDIVVYYIPLYLMGAIWAGFAVERLGLGDWQFGTMVQSIEKQNSKDEASENADKKSADKKAKPKILQSGSFSAILAMLVFLLPLQLMRDYTPQIENFSDDSAREVWEAILAAEPAENAILISNDRNEIVPLFYLQNVENRRTDITGLFPLISPEARFADVGATIQAALDANVGADTPQPIYLIKEMPGIEARFDLNKAAPPLVKVQGHVAQNSPSYALNKPFGPLQLLGYDWERDGETVQIALHWQVENPLDADYTTTVQLFDSQGEKLGQDDRLPGGAYYPTTFWKVGERLVDWHEIILPSEKNVSGMLIGMYVGPEFRQLAPPIEISVEE